MMRPEELAGEVLRRWWIILIVTLVAALVGYVGTVRQAKTYTSSVRLIAIAEPADYWLDLYAKNRLASYKDLINSWDFVNGALQSAGLDYIDPGQAQSTLQLGHNPDTNTVQIVVVDSDPARSADIANALAAGFIELNEEQNEDFVNQVQDIEDRYPGRVNLLALEQANPPATASGPRVKVNTVAAGLLGLTAGFLLVFYLIYRDDTLKNETDLERYLETPLLTRIPDSFERANTQS